MWAGARDTGDGTLLTPLHRYRDLRTADPDEFRSAAGSLLSTHSIRVSGGSDATPFRGDVRSARIGDVHVVYLEQGVDVDVDILDRIDYYDLMIAVAGTNRLEVADGGERAIVAGPTAAILSPRMRARMRMDGAYRQLHLRVEQRTVQDRLEAITGRATGNPITFDLAMDLGGPAMSSWMSALHLLLRDLDDDSGLAAHPMMARHWQDLLITGLLMSHGHNHSDRVHCETHEAVHPKAFRRALEFIESGLAGPLTVSDVAAHIGVSTRSLQRTFQEQLAIAPAAYIQGERLDRVRAELREPTARTITDIAYGWGFTHPSRFAAMYRRRFGESPSQTRQSSQC
ncbi:helix-turn-helix transcriptional regulator [Gordonia rhizosphera]|uniref:Putative AraC family transcriptional regulator n=1 Tax=Gordonia rhizosphera NBRC 16068 TaxID=1108045 RepID=K6WF75_9ACTN|nr:AraC family transcriptional regulator [Gordonia rhizosphera]GAB92401.1 putative AraC family transcriptional regulator [Gordonia rhizosphera NBRC 16068]